jgi:hypothetical protein
MNLETAMKKKGKEKRGMLVAGRRGSDSRPEKRGSRPPTFGAPASGGARGGPAGALAPPYDLVHQELIAGLEVII